MITVFTIEGNEPDHSHVDVYIDLDVPALENPAQPLNQMSRSR